MQEKRRKAVHRIHFDSPVGTICLEDDGEALSAFYFEEESGGEDFVSDLLLKAKQELGEYFAGMRTSFDLPLHLEGTEFQRKVWDALAQIPYGETRSYSEIAEAVGHPGACRAVGGANHKNPLMILIPCHRVVGKNGDLVGFAGGVNVKKYLLEMEAAKKRKKSDSSNTGNRKRVRAEQTDLKEKKFLREIPSNYGRKVTDGFTLEDYYALPKEWRVELIDGVFYDLAEPDLAHQGMTGALHWELMNYMKTHKGQCLPLIAPFDVRLDRDDRTMVRPDVAVVCDRNKAGNGRCVFGAPDFIIEVLSEATRKKDLGIKLEKYRGAGVKEYWVIDLKGRRVITYDFVRQGQPCLYGLDRVVPVGIFHGECQINFSEICECSGFLFDEKE